MSGIGNEEAGVALGEISTRPRRRGWIAAVVVVVALASAGGVGGYLIGNDGGTDLETARAEGAEAGEAGGVQDGGRRGYDLGYDLAEKVAFEKNYNDQYKDAFRAAFEDVGLDAPELADIEVSEK